MSNRQALGWVVLLPIVLMAGCHEPQSQTPQESAASSRQTFNESQDLCLADPGGLTPLDQNLRSLQHEARKRSTLSGSWILIGGQWVRKARIASDPGYYVNVEGCAAAALALEPDPVAALGLRSLVLMNDHRFDEARQLALAILDRHPEDEIALGALSDALLELGLYEEAARAAQRQMNVRPGMAAHARGSYIRWLQGDTDSAKTFIRDALIDRDTRDPEPAAWAFAEAAAIFWHEGDYDGADAVYTESLKWVPDYAPALVGRARIALAKHEPRQAIEHLEKAYRSHPLPETAWLLGDAWEMLGDPTSARDAYASVVRQGRRGDKLTLALFYATKNRDIDEALRLIEEERKSRRGIYVEDAYSWVLYRAGRIAEAQKASDLAVAIGTKDARLLYHAGAIRIAAGNVESGRELVRQSLSLNPMFDRTGTAEARKLVGGSVRLIATNSQERQ
jgi:tetratricopeptide (TPR) repeat protein